MKWKTTLLLLLATIGLGAYIALYEIRQPSPKQRDEVARQVVDIPSDTVTRLAIDDRQTKVTLTHQEGGWHVDPPGARADTEAISRILDAIAPLTAGRLLTGRANQALEPSAYGLLPPATRLTVTTDAGSTTLLFGDATPVAGHRYLQRADRPEIFVVPSALLDAIDQPAETFRDRRLLPFDSRGAEALDVASPQATFRLGRRDDDWRLLEPVDDKADRLKVSTLLGELEKLESRRFLEDGAGAPADDATRGLEPPQSQLTLSHGKPPQTTTLRFGNVLPDDASLRYAVRSDEPYRYAVSAKDLEALFKDPASLRSRACFEFFTGDAHRVEVAWQARLPLDLSGGQARPPGPGARQSQAGAGGARWIAQRVDDRWQSDVGAGLDTDRVEQFLNELVDVRVSGFPDGSLSDLAPLGLAEPAGEIAVWAGDGETPQRLLVGAIVPGSSGRYGLIETRHVLGELPEDMTRLLATTLDDLSTAPAGAASQPYDASASASPDQSRAALSSALPDEPAGPEHPLDDGGVDEHGQGD